MWSTIIIIYSGEETILVDIVNVELKTTEACKHILER